MNAGEPFLRALEAHTDRMAITEPGGASITYAGLRDCVNGFAAQLAAAGMEAGDRVVIQVPPGIGFTIASVSTFLAGGTPVFCEPGLGDGVYNSRIAAAGARWVLVHPVITWANRLPFARRLLKRREVHVPPCVPRSVVDRHVRVTAGGLRAAATTEAFEVRPRANEDDGLLIFTGGTTSAPKGVRLSHGALEHYLGNIASVIEGLDFGSILADTPQQVLYGLRLGRSVYVTRGRTQRRAVYVERMLREGHAEAYFGSPYLWTEIMRRAGGQPRRMPETVQVVLLGGAPVTPAFLERLRDLLHPATRVITVYGLTEAGPVCTATAEEKMAWDQPGDWVGRPLGTVRVSIDTPQPPQELGEVLVHGPSLYTGYIGQPDRLAEEPLHTGDLGRLVEQDGVESLVLLGRMKDMIIREGVNIYPPLHEPSLLRIRSPQGSPMIQDCALLGLWNPQRQDEDVVLCYVPAAGIQVDTSFLLREAGRVMGPDGAPDHLYCTDQFPVVGRQNKTDKALLRRRAAAALGQGLRASREDRAPSEP